MPIRTFLAVSPTKASNPSDDVTIKEAIPMKALFRAYPSASVAVSHSFALPSDCPLPLFRIGQRVLWTDCYNSFTHRVLGTICGFEYIDHPDFASGWSYILCVEESIVIRPDGTVARLTTSKIETAPEHELTIVTGDALVTA